MKKKLDENSIDPKSLLDSPKNSYTNIMKVKKELKNMGNILIN